MVKAIVWILADLALGGEVFMAAELHQILIYLPTRVVRLMLPRQLVERSKRWMDGIEPKNAEGSCTLPEKRAQLADEFERRSRRAFAFNIFEFTSKR